MPKIFLWLAALLAATSPVTAVAAEPFTTAKVLFRNPGPYAQADLEAAAGVHPGDKVTLAGIKAAAQRLVETQAFTNVTMDSSGAANALTLIFVLKPLPVTEMLPVGFENFVWLTPAEIREAVHKDAPLFQGSLPAGSSETDAIGNALQKALLAKGVAAQVTHEEVQPSTAQPVHAIEFRVEKPSVTVDRIQLEETGPRATEVAKIAEKLRATPYAEGYASDSTERLLLRPYLDAGFLDAHLVDRTVTVHGGAAADAVRVEVHAGVDPGAEYRVGTLAFKPTPLVSQSTFAAAAQLHAGDVASQKQLLASVATFDAAYQKLGYVDEYVDTGAVLDRGAHLVNYELTVVPGEQYRLHAVSTENLSTTAQAQFNLAWIMKPGDLYNAEYVRGFLGNNTAMRGLAGYTGTFQAASDPQTHTVDLKLIFFPTTGHR